jgi:hypothetical protein
VSTILLFREAWLTGHSIIAVHGIEACSPTTWTAYERDAEPRGRARNWLVDEDMLPSIVPQARIWVFDYNSRYSSDAQDVRIEDLGKVFLSFLSDRKHELGTRPIVFIGSCFGGIVVAQVGFPKHAPSRNIFFEYASWANTFIPRHFRELHVRVTYTGSYCSPQKVLSS